MYLSKQICTFTNKGRRLFHFSRSHKESINKYKLFYPKSIFPKELVVVARYLSHRVADNKQLASDNRVQVPDYKHWGRGSRCRVRERAQTGILARRPMNVCRTRTVCISCSSSDWKTKALKWLSLCVCVVCLADCSRSGLVEWVLSKGGLFMKFRIRGMKLLP